MHQSIIRAAVAFATTLALACSAERRSADVARGPSVRDIPPGLHEESMALDRQRGAFILVGGIREDSTALGGYAPNGDTFEWQPGSGWSRRVHSASDPSARALPALELDPTTNTLLMLGGEVTIADSVVGAVKPCPSCPFIRTLDDAWSFDGSAWAKREAAPSVTYPRFVFDSRRRTMFLLGNRGSRLGQDGEFPVLVWQRNGITWTLADSSGPRTVNAPIRAVFDANRGVIVLPVLEGPDAGVWEWSERWRRVAPSPGPSVRRRFGVAYDETRKVVLIFGGSTEGQRWNNDLWSWDGAKWSLVHGDSATAPSPRSDGSLIYDPASRRLLQFGGLGPRDALLREIWAFANSAWVKLE